MERGGHTPRFHQVNTKTKVSCCFLAILYYLLSVSCSRQEVDMEVVPWVPVHSEDPLNLVPLVADPLAPPGVHPVGPPPLRIWLD